MSAAVAGICSAVIENCWAKCALSGGRYVGGITGTGVTDSITGSGSTVSGCTSLVSITDYSQYAGAISGSGAGAFADNVFVSDTLAGLDGASAAGQAEPVAYETLLENEALPDAFRTFTVQFVAGRGGAQDRRSKLRRVPAGQRVPGHPRRRRTVRRVGRADA